MAALVASAQDPPDSRGLYVYSWEVANTYLPGNTGSAEVVQLRAAMNTKSIDGITLVFDWNTIEPGQGTFVWAAQPNVLDKWIDAAIDAAQTNQRPFHVVLAVRAGFGTPCWLFNQGDCPSDYRLYNPSYTGPWAGAPAMDLYASAHQGLGKCMEVIMAPPWNQTFQAEWANMVHQLSQHLQATTYKGVREYDAISIVRIDGMNRTTDEFRIPAEVLPGSECNLSAPANAVQSWLDAGYRPSKILQAWDQLSSDLVADFGDKIVNVAIIPTGSGSTTDLQTGNAQFPFPPINEKGCVYLSGIPDWARSLFSGDCTISATKVAASCTSTTKKCIPDQNRPLVTLAARKIGGNLNVEFENLHFGGNGQPAPAEPTVVKYAEKFGTLPGFQTNNYLGDKGGGASCTDLATQQRCSPSQYLALLESGIDPSSTDQYLHSHLVEVFYPDIDAPECPDTTNPSNCGYPAEISTAHTDIVNPPVVTIAIAPAATPTHWYTALPVTGSISASSSVQQTITDLSCSGAITASGVGGFNVSIDKQGGPVRLTCRATDAAGHLGESIRALWIDTEPPVTTATVQTYPGLTTVIFTAKDNISGVAQTQFRVDSGGWHTGTTTSLSVVGRHTVEFYSVDVAGNVEPTQSITVFVLRPLPCGTQCV